MMRVIPASSADALALVDRRVTRDLGLVRRVRTIVAAVRRGGDAALIRYARRFDGLDGDIELPIEEVRRLAGTAPLDVRRAVAACARHIRHRCPGAVAARRPDRGGAWRRHRAHGDAPQARRVLRAGRTILPAVVASDDRDSGTRRGRQ